MLTFGDKIYTFYILCRVLILVPKSIKITRIFLAHRIEVESVLQDELKQQLQTTELTAGKTKLYVRQIITNVTNYSLTKIHLQTTRKNQTIPSQGSCFMWVRVRCQSAMIGEIFH